jgi:predicted alpha/beta superfamily hydrolase
MLKKWNIEIPELSGHQSRRVYVYLPDYYDIDPDRHYPVMYMFDGHNVFLDEDATFGKSWGMNSYMSWTRKPLIIVGVECNHEGNNRLREYAPFDFENGELGYISSQGRVYMDWLVNTLKPYIDAHYRTLRDRGNTIICGSSMGGLMALYGGTEYNHVFQRAACLSPSIWVNSTKVLELMDQAKIHENTTIYMDYGELEMGNHDANREALISAAQLLMRKNVNLTLRIIPGGTHSEASWEKQIPVFMSCLGL